MPRERLSRPAWCATIPAATLLPDAVGKIAAGIDVNQDDPWQVRLQYSDDYNDGYKAHTSSLRLSLRL